MDRVRLPNSNECDNARQAQNKGAGACPLYLDQKRSYYREKGQKLRPTSRIPFQPRLLRWLSRHIMNTMKDIPPLAAATLCALVIHQYDPFQSKTPEKFESWLSEGLHSTKKGSPSVGQGSINEISPKSNRILALAMKTISTPKVPKVIAVRISHLDIPAALNHPPPLLFLAASIIFSMSIGLLLHSQKKHPYRNHILWLGTLLGILVAALRSGESFLLDAKGYLAGSTILALLLSAFVHGILDCWQDSNADVCARGTEGPDRFELVDEVGSEKDNLRSMVRTEGM